MFRLRGVRIRFGRGGRFDGVFGGESRSVRWLGGLIGGGRVLGNTLLSYCVVAEEYIGAPGLIRG